MLISMTGFGHAESEFEYGRLVIEVQCLNRKHLEISVNLPKEWSRFEIHIRRIVQSIIKRGKISVQILWNKPQFPATSIEVDFELARQYYQALQDISDDLEIEDDVTLNDVLLNKEIMKSFPVDYDLQVVQEVLEKTSQYAIEKAQEMRRIEGDYIAKDIYQRTEVMDGYISEIEAILPKYLKEYKEKINKKIKSLLDVSSDSEALLLKEVSVLTEKMDVTEEITRLNSHLKQLQSYFEYSEPIGKLVDFVLQEMNREINTIGAKSSDVKLSKIVIEMKNEIEKLREQIQNVE